MGNDEGGIMLFAVVNRDATMNDEWCCLWWVSWWISKSGTPVPEKGRGGGGRAV